MGSQSTFGCNCNVCGAAQHVNEIETENKKLRKEIELILKNNWCHINCKKQKEDYWKGVVDTCRKLMPAGNDGVCLDTFIRSLLFEIEKLKSQCCEEDNEKLRRTLKWRIEDIRKLETIIEKLKKDRAEVFRRLAKSHESSAQQYRSIIAMYCDGTEPLAKIFSV